VGGTSPAQKPEVAIATLDGAKNVVPWFITQKGPIREARFKLNPDGTPDGNVHNLFVITGRADAVGCNIAQPDFLPAGNPLTGQGGNPNIVFRIPTPVFGAGLLEAIPDSAILANMRANASLAVYRTSWVSRKARTSSKKKLATRDWAITTAALGRKDSGSSTRFFAFSPWQAQGPVIAYRCGLVGTYCCSWSPGRADAQGKAGGFRRVGKAGHQEK
jgi:hypothetical protein